MLKMTCPLQHGLYNQQTTPTNLATLVIFIVRNYVAEHVNLIYSKALVHALAKVLAASDHEEEMRWNVWASAGVVPEVVKVKETLYLTFTSQRFSLKIRN